MRSYFSKRKLFLFLISIYIFFLTTVKADTEGKLTIVTSFPSETTTIFKNAFENKFPDVEIEIIKKSTSRAVKHIKEMRYKNTADIFWVSSPDAFEVLKVDGLLQKYDEIIPGIPEKIGSSAVNDADGFYKGFSVSGYGIMENKHYTKALNLPIAKEWDDLKKTIYKEHIGMCSPSRSGTTHLIVEILLQSEGWIEGWYSWKEIAANLKKITQKSSNVPSGVNNGSFGLGVVVDFYGLSHKSMGFPIMFHYPALSPLIPANIAIIKNSANETAAKSFIKFVLSDTGQKILLDPRISRLPINPRAYSETPREFPNPFKSKDLGSRMTFGTHLSKSRYSVVNSLFDSMITYNLKGLKKAITAIREAESVFDRNSNKEAEKLILKAKGLVAKVPVDEGKASGVEFNSIFKTSRKNKNTKITGKQAEIEDAWDKEIKENYIKAIELAEKARWLK